MSLEITLAYQDLEQIRQLFEEYTAMLGIDLGFQNYQEELHGLPGAYGLPGGRLYLARVEGEPAGCVALRPFDGEACEMKRLFVRPQFRGKGIGMALARQVIDDGREMGCRAMLLDTMASLASSIPLYRKLGFREIPPYRYNPQPDALYFRLEL